MPTLNEIFDKRKILCRDVCLRGRDRDDGQCAGRFGL